MGDPRPVPLQEHPARDFDALRRDPAVVGAEEAGDGRADIVRHTDAPQGDDIGEGFVIGRRSVPQFTREYRRLFGLPPGRELRAARAA